MFKPLTLAILVLSLWGVPLKGHSQTPPACVTVEQPQFGGVKMCKEAALELENAMLKQKSLTDDFDKITAEYRQKAQALAVTQNTIVLQVLKENPGYSVDPNGTFTKKQSNVPRKLEPTPKR